MLQTFERVAALGATYLEEETRWLRSGQVGAGY